MTETAYAQDFYRWTQEQARVLRDAARAGASLPVDWENVAEEIESLGRWDRREITSRLATITEHLLKLQHSPAREPRPGWQETILRERLTVERLIAESPSLRPDLPEIAVSAWKDSVKLARASLVLHGEAEAARRVARASAPYSAEQLVAEDWFPPEPE